MPGRKTVATANKSAGLDLAAQVHEQKLEFFRMAEGSGHLEIRQAALKQIEYLNNQNRKVSPGQVMAVAAVVCTVAVIACVFAVVRFASPLGWEITSIVVAFALLLILVCLLVSAHLTELSFMRYVELMWRKFMTKDTATAPWIGKQPSDES